MTNEPAADRDHDVVGGPEHDEQRTDVMGDPEPGSDVMGGPEHDEQRSDLIGGGQG